MRIQWTMTFAVVAMMVCLGSGLNAADARKARSARSHGARGAQQGVAESARGANQGVAESARGADQGVAESATGARNVNEAGISRYEDQPIGTATTDGSNTEYFDDGSRINRRTGSQADQQAMTTRPDHAPPLAAPVPEGLALPTGDPSWKLDDLRGRTVLVLFIQTMNFTEAAPLGELLKQLHERWADHPAVVLSAVKTDDGDPEETARFLARYVDPDRWRCAADPHGLWSYLLCGESHNGNYAIIGPDGALVGFGRALPPRHENVSTDPQFDLGEIDLASTGASARPDPPMELADLPTPLAQTLKLAVYGQYDRALAGYGEHATDRQLRDDAMTLREAIMRLAEREVDTQAAALHRGDAVSRYHAYLRLQALRRQLGRSEPGLAAAEALGQVTGEPFIRQSLISANHYRTLTHRAAQAEANAPQILQAGLADLHEDQPDSYHGHIAGEALKRIEAASSTMVQAP